MYLKKKVYRILKIIMLLEGRHRKLNAAEIANILGISVRTFHRDRDLIENLNIPIYYNQEKQSYDIKDTFQFKTPDLNREEVIALLLTGQAFTNRNFPYPAELETAIAKILNSLPYSLKNILENYKNFISFENSPEVNLSAYRDIIKNIGTAINECKTIKIKYYTLSRDDTTIRKIDPFNVFYKKGAAYLTGYCHKRKDILLFRVDRIKEFEITNNKFNIPENYSLSDYTGNAWGVERGIDINVKIRFTDFAARYVQEYEWHTTQDIKKLDSDTILYSVTTGSREEIKSWILSFGADAEVLEPEDLRNEIKEEIEKILKKY